MKEKEKFDKYYTNYYIAKMIVDKLPTDKFYHILEPSAGDGAFIRHLNKFQYTALDLMPENENITQQDFFEYQHKITMPTITLMNPPFGKNSGLAIKFFNKAAEFSEYIYWIAPLTFARKPLQNRLSLEFTCIHSEALPVKSFHSSDGKLIAVKTCFQIWKKQKREKYVFENICNDFEFVNPKTEDWDFIIRDQGFYAGKIIGQNTTNFKLPISSKCNVYDAATFNCGVMVAVKCKIDKKTFFDRFNSIFDKLNKLSQNTTGSNNLSKGEIIEIYNNEYSDFKFVEYNDDWDFAIKNIGFNAGKMVAQTKTNYLFNLGPKTKQFDKLENKECCFYIKVNIDFDEFYKKYSKAEIEINKYAKLYTGIEHISKNEIIEMYNNF